jgi:hypothetical protein
MDPPHCSLQVCQLPLKNGGQISFLEVSFQPEIGHTNQGRTSSADGSRGLVIWSSVLERRGGMLVDMGRVPVTPGTREEAVGF